MAPTRPKAKQIEFVPGGGLAATDLQSALTEIDSEKVASGFDAPVAYAAGLSFTNTKKKRLHIATKFIARPLLRLMDPGLRQLALGQPILANFS